MMSMQLHFHTLCIYEIRETQSNAKIVQYLQGIDVCLGHRVQMKLLFLDAQSQVVGWMRIRHAQDTIANQLPGPLVSTHYMIQCMCGLYL